MSKNKAVAVVADAEHLARPLMAKRPYVVSDDPYAYYSGVFRGPGKFSATTTTTATNRKLKGKNGSSAATATATETYFQKTVWTYLSRTLPETAVAWATPNASGGREREREGAQQKQMGRVAGIPDLFVLHGGRLHGIELKRPPARLASGKESQAKPAVSDAQQDVMRRLAIAGAPCRVCRSIDEVADFLTQCGVPLKARVTK